MRAVDQKQNYQLERRKSLVVVSLYIVIHVIRTKLLIKLQTLNPVMYRLAHRN